MSGEGRVSSLYDWTHGEDCDWQFCRNKATGRCCVCWGEPYCTPPTASPEEREDDLAPFLAEQMKDPDFAYHYGRSEGFHEALRLPLWRRVLRRGWLSAPARKESARG